MKKVTDRADDLTYTGAMDFKDGAGKAEEYTYDANGNMTSDLNRGIVSITYNQLNLPQSVLFKDGHESRATPMPPTAASCARSTASTTSRSSTSLTLQESTGRSKAP